MNFNWNDEQLEYKDAAVRFAQQEMSTGILKQDREEVIPSERWRKCADFGMLGFPFPEIYGKADADILTTMLVMEGLVYVGKDNGLLG